MASSDSKRIEVPPNTGTRPISPRPGAQFEIGEICARDTLDSKGRRMGSRVLCPRQRPRRASSGLTCRRSRGPGVPMRGLGRGGLPDQVHSRIRRHLEKSSGQQRSRVFQAGKRQFCAASIRTRWGPQTRLGQLLRVCHEIGASCWNREAKVKVVSPLMLRHRTTNAPNS